MAEWSSVLDMVRVRFLVAPRLLLFFFDPEFLRDPRWSCDCSNFVFSQTWEGGMGVPPRNHLLSSACSDVWRTFGSQPSLIFFAITFVLRYQRSKVVWFWRKIPRIPCLELVCENAEMMMVNHGVWGPIDILVFWQRQIEQPISTPLSFFFLIDEKEGFISIISAHTSYFLVSNSFYTSEIREIAWYKKKKHEQCSDAPQGHVHLDINSLSIFLTSSAWSYVRRPVGTRGKYQKKRCVLTLAEVLFLLSHHQQEWIFWHRTTLLMLRYLVVV